MAEYFPAAQREHEVDPDKSWNCPAAQSEQLPAPVLEKEPATQDAQTATPPVDEKPAAQFVQAETPETAEYIPATHIAQLMEPVEPWYVVEAQLTQALCPAVEENEPAKQLEQMLVLRPITIENLPAAQLEHAD